MNEQLVEKFTCAVEAFTCVVSRLASFQRLEETILASLQRLEEKLMSALSDYAAKQTAFNTRMGTAVDGIVSDVRALNAKIDALQASPGAITPEDQAILNELEKQGDALAVKTEALDALTPPAPPTA